MAWEAADGIGIDASQAKAAGTQAGTFLADAVHAEVDGAMVEPVQVLMDPHSPGMAVYALAAVRGPLRAYLASAWGRAGHVAAKQIVSYPTIEEARQALQMVADQRLAGRDSERRYVRIGVFQAVAGEEGPK